MKLDYKVPKFPFESIVGAIAYLSYLGSTPKETGQWITLFIITVLGILQMGRAAAVQLVIDDASFESPTMLQAGADPWELQADVMARSGQDMPECPTITKASLTYMALIFEEAGETAEALAAAIDAPKGSQLEELRLYIKSQGLILRHKSKTIRAMITPSAVEALSGRLIPLKLARALLDGTTDIAVVNCGFAIGTGLPGMTGYSDCVLSNISKANPDTGRIDLDASGKWIKGPDFIDADFDRILLSTGAYDMDDRDQAA